MTAYNRTDCPYCTTPLDPLPRAKKRCPSCGQPIYVRSAPDGTKQLLREDDLEAHAELWAELHDRQADKEEAANNAEAARVSRQTLQSFARFGMRLVEMTAPAPGICPACAAVAGRRFLLADVPPIPVPGCSNGICRCAYMPVVGRE